MSFSALNWAYEAECPSGTAKSVLAYIANCASQAAGECWPSIATIAARTQHKADTVRRALRELVKAGLLAVIPRQSARGGWLTNLYRLQFESPPLPPQEGEPLPPAFDSPPQSENGGGIPLYKGGSIPPQGGAEPLERKIDRKRSKILPPLRVGDGDPEAGDLFRDTKGPAPDSTELVKQTAPQGECAEASDDLEAIAYAWNCMATDCALPTIRVMTPKRRASLANRVKEVGIEAMMTAIANVRQSGFLCGKNDSGFRADFDFLLQPKTLIRTIEGRYAGMGKKQSGLEAVLDVVGIDPWTKGT